MADALAQVHSRWLYGTPETGSMPMITSAHRVSALANVWSRHIRLFIAFMASYRPASCEPVLYWPVDLAGQILPAAVVAIVAPRFRSIGHGVFIDRGAISLVCLATLSEPLWAVLLARDTLLTREP